MERHLVFVYWETWYCKNSILLNLIYKHSSYLSAEINKLLLKFIWKFKRPILSQAETILKKSRVGGLIFPASKTADNIKIVWYGHKDRHMYQWDRTGNSEISPSIYGQLIFNKSSKTIQRGKERSFQQMVLGQLDIHMEKNDNGLLPHIRQKVNSDGSKI